MIKKYRTWQELVQITAHCIELATGMYVAIWTKLLPLLQQSYTKSCDPQADLEDKGNRGLCLE